MKLKNVATAIPAPPPVPPNPIDALVTELIADGKLSGPDVMKIVEYIKDDGVVTRPEQEKLEKIEDRYKDELTRLGKQLINGANEAEDRRTLNDEDITKILTASMREGISEDNAGALTRFISAYRASIKPTALAKLEAFLTPETQQALAAVQQLFDAARAQGGVDLMEAVGLIRSVVADGTLTPHEDQLIRAQIQEHDRAVNGLVTEAFDTMIDAQNGRDIGTEQVRDLVEEIPEDGLEPTDRDGLDAIVKDYWASFDTKPRSILNEIIEDWRRPGDLLRARGLIDLAAIGNFKASEVIEVFDDVNDDGTSNREMQALDRGARDHERAMNRFARAVYMGALSGERGRVTIHEVRDILDAAGGSGRGVVKDFRNMYRRDMDAEALAAIEQYLNPPTFP